ncbi:hypothetical protein [Pseudoalteromonas sp. T1lg88]|uniref:hypothetical protein n=1 Tax=Pseudoalteromonas sp. T1lg88 TaxID=2077104 RepID=UPI000CF6C4A1|nr:hypothetical protein [Pseudoalteromonas sp. T1lg88]
MNWTTTAICYFYFLCVGGLYLYGFWTPLHFNILQFLSPLDVIKSAVYPLIPTLLTILVLTALDAYNSQGIQKPEENDAKAIKGLFYIFIFAAFLGVLLLLVVVGVNVWEAITTVPEKKLLYALPVISIGVMIYLIKNPPVLKGKNKIFRNLVIMFTSLLPTYSHTAGYNEITATLEEKKSLYYLKKSTKNCVVGTGVRMIYLGMYGQSYFFLNPENKDICVEKEHGLVLKFQDRKLKD